MAMKLVCTVPMHGIRKGEEITDADEIARLLASNANHFVKLTYTPDEPAPVEPAPEDHA